MVGVENSRCDDVGSLKLIAVDCVYFGLQSIFGVWKSLQLSNAEGTSL